MEHKHHIGTPTPTHTTKCKDTGIFQILKHGKATGQASSRPKGIECAVDQPPEDFCSKQECYPVGNRYKVSSEVAPKLSKV